MYMYICIIMYVRWINIHTCTCTGILYVYTCTYIIHMCIYTCTCTIIHVQHVYTYSRPSGIQLHNMYVHGHVVLRFLGYHGKELLQCLIHSSVAGYSQSSASSAPHRDTATSEDSATEHIPVYNYTYTCTCM